MDEVMETSSDMRLKEALLAQNLKVEQLTGVVEQLMSERDRERETVGALRLAVFESSTKAHQLVEQCKRDAVAVAVEEISRDREVFAEGREEICRQLEQCQSQLRVALNAAASVHEHLLSLGMSCEDLGKTSVQLSIMAQEDSNPKYASQDVQALVIARAVTAAMVGVMRSMEQSGVFNLLEPVAPAAPKEEGRSNQVLTGGQASHSGAPATLPPRAAHATTAISTPPLGCSGTGESSEPPQELDQGTKGQEDQTVREVQGHVGGQGEEQGQRQELQQETHEAEAGVGQGMGQGKKTLAGVDEGPSRDPSATAGQRERWGGEGRKGDLKGGDAALASSSVSVESGRVGLFCPSSKWVSVDNEENAALPKGLGCRSVKERETMQDMYERLQVGGVDGRGSDSGVEEGGGEERPGQEEALQEGQQRAPEHL